MYKPGTTLIITDLWAAAAAHKLGFEVESFWQASRGVWVKDFCLYMIEGASLITINKWRITVTESGPNAVKKFLPQVDDVVMLAYAALIVIGVTADKCFCKGDWFPFETVPGDLHPYRILERDGTSFPQFSEVIEP